MDTNSDTFRVLGLNQSEVKIVTALTMHPRNVSEISKVTKIPRTSLGYMLAKLKRRSLLSVATEGRQKRWRSEINSAFEKLQRSDSSIVTYRGKEVFGILEKLTLLPKNSRWYAIQPDRSFRAALRRNSLSSILKINNKIKSKGLIIEGVVHEKTVTSIVRELGKQGAEKLFKSFLGRLAIYTKIPDEFADVESEIYIFNGVAYLVDWAKEIAIGIHDKDMVGLIMAMFSCVRDFGIQYNQLEKMKAHSPKYASTTSLRAKTSRGLPSARS